jgi:DNA (cytosine-5)-methyltransferase 1
LTDLKPNICVPVVVDFFCGAGGFTRGALNAGAYVVCGIDCDERAKLTYETNNLNFDGIPAEFITQRIEDMSYSLLGEKIRGFDNHPLVFVGCPPCQPFTNLSTDKEKSQSSRNALGAFVDFVVDFKPGFIVVENVPGIRSSKYGTIWSDALERLRVVGYEARTEVVDAKRFGVPQTRRRTLLIAVHKDSPPWPAASFGPRSYRTVEHAFRSTKLSKLNAGEHCSEDALHVASLLSELNLSRIRATPKSGGSRTVWPAELQLDCYKDFNGYTDVYGRMDWFKPAPTLTTRFVSLSNGRFGHPDEDRAITPREGALLQTFPPDYQFLASSREAIVRHIGNAVPPLLAEEIMRAIIQKILSKNQKNGE